MTRCLTPPAIAEHLGVSPESVVDLIKSGELKGFTLSPPGSRRPRWKVDPAELAAFKERRQAKPPVAPAPKKTTTKPAPGRKWY